MADWKSSRWRCSSPDISGNSSRAAHRAPSGREGAGGGERAPDVGLATGGQALLRGRQDAPAAVHAIEGVGHVAQGRTRPVDADAGQPGAVAERQCPDDGKPRRQPYLRQRGALLERPALYGPYIFVQRQPAQGGALPERVASDGPDALRQCDVGQRRAPYESACADVGQRLAECDACKAAASGKGMAADGSDGGRHDDAAEHGAALERALAYDACGGRQHYAAEPRVREHAARHGVFFGAESVGIAASARHYRGLVKVELGKAAVGGVHGHVGAAEVAQQGYVGAVDGSDDFERRDLWE